MGKKKVSQVNVTYNNRREPIYRNVKTECCPTCKQPLSLRDAMNDGTPCACGEWWYDFASPASQMLTGYHPDNYGWHFEPTPPKKEK